MKAKLIKDHTDYHLVDDEQFIIGTTDKSMLSCTDKYKLSFSNCQAIERGYDLDELIDIELKKLPYTKHLDDGQFNDGQLAGFELGAEWAFQKALELMGNKKFSEEDMKNGIEYGIQSVLQAIPGVTSTQDVLDSYKQSLQQTEWDVEIITENVCGRCYSNNTDECWSAKECSDGKYDYSKPLLDEDGCLILKIKSEKDEKIKNSRTMVRRTR